MDDVERMRQILKLEAAARRRGVKLFKPTNMDLSDWLLKYDPKSKWDWNWHKYILPILQKAIETPSRISISLPPRSGKSYLISTRLPAYFLHRFPRRNVMNISYSALLSTKFNRESRELARGFIPLDSNHQRAGDWATILGGEFFSAGVGGSLTGRGAHLLLADDMVKNLEEATSSVVLDKIWDSFVSDYLSRGEPGYSVIIISTRWAVEDPIGKIMQSDFADQWQFINLKAIAEEDDPLGREPGEVLNPDRNTIEQLNELAEIMGQRIFRALYQGDPTVPGGDLIKVDMLRDWIPGSFEKWDDLVAYWDTSGGKYRAMTAGVLLGRYKKDYVILDVVTGNWSQYKRMNEIRKACLKWKALFGLGVKYYIEQQGGSAGEEIAHWEKGELAGDGVLLMVDRPKGSKDERILPFTAMLESNHVWMAPGAWNKKYKDELAMFPKSRTKDQTDATSGAFMKAYKKATAAIF